MDDGARGGPYPQKAEFWEALGCGDARSAKAHLDAGADPAGKPGDAWFPLLFAAGAENGGECVRLLLERGAEAGALNADGQTALMRAAKCGNIAGVEALLAAGADPLRADAAGLGALDYACMGAGEGRGGCAAAGGALLDALGPCAGLAGRGAPAAGRVLLRAAALGNASFLEEFLARAGPGPIRAKRGPQKATPLLAAAESGSEACLDRLLKHCDWDLRRRGGSGLTALVLAAAAGSRGCVKRLLEAGAEPDWPDARGRTPLIASAFAPETGAAEELLRAGADAGARDGKGYTALMWAVQMGHAEHAELLLGAGADPNASSAEGMGALYLAALGGWFVSLRLLLGAGADPDGENGLGQSSLELAVKRGDLEMARLLLAAGADPNRRGAQGIGPLALALERGAVGIAGEIFSAGGALSESEICRLRQAALGEGSKGMLASLEEKYALGALGSGGPKGPGAGRI